MGPKLSSLGHNCYMKFLVMASTQHPVHPYILVTINHAPPTPTLSHSLYLGRPLFLSTQHTKHLQHWIHHIFITTTLCSLTIPFIIIWSGICNLVRIQFFLTVISRPAFRDPACPYMYQNISCWDFYVIVLRSTPIILLYMWTHLQNRCTHRERRRELRWRDGIMRIKSNDGVVGLRS